MSSLLVLVFTLALIAVPLEGKWELKKNVYVVEMDMRRSVTVELVCDAADTAQSLRWQKGPRPLGHGAKLNVTIKEFIHGGNYTCHDSDGRILGYNFLYIKELVTLRGEEGGLLKKQRGKFIECEAKNYNGSFYCSWETKAQGMPQFVFNAQHGSHSETIPIKCADPKTADNGLTYTVACHHSELCPYAEEHAHVRIILNATQDHKFNSYTDTFVIRDIVKPDPPENLQKHKNHLSWHYPSSWSNCTTFFPLLFNVSLLEIEKPRKKNSDHSSPNWILVEGTRFSTELRVKKFCIQAKDLYHTSSWSYKSCSAKSVAEAKPKKGKAKKNKGAKSFDPGN